MGEETEAQRAAILVGALSGRQGDLVARVADVGFIPICCPTLEDAESALLQAEEPIHCALIPTELADRRLKRSLRSFLKQGARAGLHLLAVGPEPDRSTRKLLRSAGVLHALWEPVEESTLRFQLNRLTRGRKVDDIRRSRRVPTQLPARATIGGRSRDASIYSLSESGAFLETPRGCMTGALVQTELRLPNATLAIPTTVVFANVPGNLQRPNLPLGIGVRFLAPSSNDRAELHAYVESRLAQLDV